MVSPAAGSSEPQTTYMPLGCCVRNVFSTIVSCEAGPWTASGSVYSGARPRAEATSPNCTSRSTRTVDCGAAWVRPIARLVETVVVGAVGLQGQPERAVLLPEDDRLGLLGGERQRDQQALRRGARGLRAVVL